MSISHTLSNALSGLTAASRAAGVVSSNLANALTDGYGRRRLDLSAASIGGQGAGVRIDGVTRLVDRGILADRRLADAGLGNSGFRADHLSRLESALGTVGSGTTLADRVTALETALSEAGADPASDARLGAVASRLGDLATGLNTASDAVQAKRLAADRDIAGQVDTLNTQLARVADLNADITRSRNSGGDPSGLLDQRQRAIDAISSIVPLREVPRDGGQVALMTPGGQVLLDGPARQIDFTPVTTMTPETTRAAGGLSGLTLNGQPVPLDRLDGGSLSAAFDLRDDTLTGVQADLDRMAGDLAARFSGPGADPTLTAGVPGLLTDGGGPHDPADLTGLSGRLSVNGAVSAEPWRLRDGLGAVAPGPVGSAAQLDRWADALAVGSSLAPGGESRSAAGHAATITAGVSSLRVEAEGAQSHAAARHAAFREAELATGVDSDHEMQMLLRIEEAYAANARVIQTVESLMRTLMEI